MDYLTILVNIGETLKINNTVIITVLDNKVIIMHDGTIIKEFKLEYLNNYILQLANLIYSPNNLSDNTAQALKTVLITLIEFSGGNIARTNN